MDSHAEHNFKSFKEYTNILDLATGVHMYTGHLDFCGFDNAFNMADLVDGYTELAINMTCGNFEVASCHDMRIKTDAYRVRISKPVSELFEQRDVVDVEVYIQILSFNDL